MSSAREQPAADPPTGRAPGHDPRPLTRREVGVFMLVWTAAVGGWFAITVVNGAIGGTALVLAVGGGLFGVIWLLGLLILGLFLFAASDRCQTNYPATAVVRTTALAPVPTGGDV